jgi:hypothetical protein
MTEHESNSSSKNIYFSDFILSRAEENWRPDRFFPRLGRSAAAHLTQCRQTVIQQLVEVPQNG